MRKYTIEIDDRAVIVEIVQYSKDGDRIVVSTIIPDDLSVPSNNRNSGIRAIVGKKDGRMTSINPNYIWVTTMAGNERLVLKGMLRVMVSRTPVLLRRNKKDELEIVDIIDK